MFSISYLSAETDHLSLLLSGLGAILVWIGIAVLASRRFRLGRRAAAALILGGLTLLIATLGYLGTSPLPASVLSLLIAILLALWAGLQQWRARRSREITV